jgi:Ca2+:H+ antiporter
MYLVFQLNSHSYMYESTPQHIIERESVPGPAAHYFDPSSSDSDTSTSSNSDSSGSSGTRKKFKRALKGKMRGKRTNSAGSAADHAQIELSDMDSTMLEEQEGEQSKKSKKKHRKKQGDAAPVTNEAADSTVPENAAAPATRAVDFAVAPDLESQTEPVTRSRTGLLNGIRPSISKTISQSVFAKHPARPEQQARGGSTAPSQPAARRTKSLPEQLHQTYRAGPGEIPSIVPLFVSSQQIAKAKEEEEPEQHMSRTSAVILLLISTGLVAVCAEFMVDSINEVVEGNSGISEAFIGVILLPIVGNAAEHVTAVTVAMKNKMDLAIGVAVGSSIQIAIFVTPLVVILGWILNKQMSLFFTLFETVSLFVSAFIVNFLVLDGRSNYLEGALLISAYVIIAVAAFFYPNEEETSSVGGGNATSADEHAVIEAAGRVMVRGLANLVAAQ